MPWFKVDDGFPDHPKLERIEDRPMDHALAVAAWTLLGADCMKPERRTDGRIMPTRIRKVLPWPLSLQQRACKALVECGLWEAVDGGYQFHDWPDYQPTAEEIEADKRAATERQKRWRKKQREARNGGGGDDGGGAPVDPSTPPSTNGATNGKTHAAKDPLVGASRARSPVPSRPVPSRDAHSPSERSGARAPLASRPAESAEGLAGYVQAGLEARLASHKAVPTWTETNLRHVQVIADWLASTQGVDPEAACDLLLDTWVGDAWTAANGFPLGDLANRPARYFAGRTEDAEALRERARAALAAKDFETYRELSKRVEKLEGSHA